MSQRSEGIGGNHYGCVSLALTLESVPDVEAAHLRAAATHDRAALLHEQAAELFEMMGLPSLARGERAHARLDREGAAAELESAQLRHDASQLERGAAKDAPVRNRALHQPVDNVLGPDGVSAQHGVTSERAARFRTRLGMPAGRRASTDARQRPLRLYLSRCPSSSPLSRMRPTSLNVPSISSMW